MPTPFRTRAGAIILKDQALLLIEYQDEHGIHYNLPGGGVEPGESIKDAVKREVKEEACIDVSVGELITVYEYLPNLASFRYGDVASLQLFFLCEMDSEQTPSLPNAPDPHQTDVVWAPLHSLQTIKLFPSISEILLASITNKRFVPFIQESKLNNPL
ncbi:NUDIX domain-containing protein [Alkalicoccobacillus gibsonii]|uniref:NUDIX domain-containing protein n=1 Tax=Alkalicoccobacillus gibsonii TaxID=79881 RepID=UPI001932FDC2|nr:NUDIX domain-containing protein [Alkalicoccobacillus gibsonii]MBM0066027.1 NUDIX domain-containing protein [Alkalicoccobacillus gibsonii]